MAKPTEKKKGKKGRHANKRGRNLAKCAAYKARGQRERNKEARARRIAKGFRSAA